MPGKYNTKKRQSQKKKVYRKKPVSVPTTNLVKLIKSVTLKQCETKHTDSNVAKTELYHNTYINLGDPFSRSYPLEGTGDEQRIGDKIVQRGIKLKFLIGQKYDRPNVTFKLWLLKLPRGQSLTSYLTIFDQQTGNVLLDPVNSDNVKVMWSKTIHKNYPNLATPVPGTVESREITFPVQTYIRCPKNITFVTNGGTDQGYSDTDHVLIVTCYDAYGTLTTDNCGYIQTFMRYYYKDP